MKNLALAATLALLVSPAIAGPTDYESCGRFDAFRAAIAAEGYTRWPGYRYKIVDGIPKRAEQWYNEATEEHRFAVADQINGWVVARSLTCVTLMSDRDTDLWRVK